MKERDLHSQPFKIMVVLGESHVAGEEASKESHRWVNIAAHLITRFQGIPDLKSARQEVARTMGARRKLQNYNR